jgi:hypothetical protein
MSALHQCPICKKQMKSARSLHNHKYDAHSPRALRKRLEREAEARREPSIGSLAVDAELDAAMGFYSLDQEWLR